jgi:8-oxo-dGTP pyrophosphatase MutT (NUDIX family)
VPDSSSAGSSGRRGEPEFLLIRRAAGRIFPGLWQCVTGAPEPGERIPSTALREVIEETGIGPTDIEAFYDLDMVSSFYDEGPDAIVNGAVFALRVRPDAEPRLSHEHDDLRWVADEARASLSGRATPRHRSRAALPHPGPEPAGSSSISRGTPPR